MKKHHHSEKYTNQNELKAKTREIIDDVNCGERYIVMRYSKPMAVLLSMEEYCQLNENDPDKCKKCQAVITNAIKKAKK